MSDSLLPSFRALRVAAPVARIDELAPAVADVPLAPGSDDAVVAVEATAVNPSDVKAALGAMPQAVWPRTPGRDYAGVVVAGPTSWIGRAVWGSSGALGITRDGAHGTHLVVPAAWLREKPEVLSFREAASVGVPFVTAAQGFAEAGGVEPGQVVLVLGSNGQVGQAAVQLALAAGARVFAVARGAAAGRITAASFIPASADVAAEVRAATGGRGADIVFNTVGSPYFAAGNGALAKLGRHIFISTIDRAVPFDIMAFYRGRHRFIGVDSLALPGAETADLLAGMAAGFASGALAPPVIPPSAVFGLHQARAAYAAALAGASGRVVIEPGREGTPS